MTADQSSYILVYRSDSDEASPVLAGIWRGRYPGRGAEESIGPFVRQGLAGFNEHATWKDLAKQLEDAGFRRVGYPVDVVISGAKDIVRIIFQANRQISCQWLTHGPDDNVRAADKPIAILPPSGDN